MAWDLFCVPLLRMKTLLPRGGSQLSEVKRQGTQRLLLDEEECGNSNKRSSVHHSLLSPEPGLGAALGWGPEGQAGSQPAEGGASELFVLMVSRHGERWPFLAWAQERWK